MEGGTVVAPEESVAPRRCCRPSELSRPERGRWRDEVRLGGNGKGSCSQKSGVVGFSPALGTKCEATDSPGKYNNVQKSSWNKNVPFPKCQNDVLTLAKAVVAVK